MKKLFYYLLYKLFKIKEIYLLRELTVKSEYTEDIAKHIQIIVENYTVMNHKAEYPDVIGYKIFLNFKESKSYIVFAHTKEEIH